MKKDIVYSFFTFNGVRIREISSPKGLTIAVQGRNKQFRHFSNIIKEAKPDVAQAKLKAYLLKKHNAADAKTTHSKSVVGFAHPAA